MSQTFGNVHSFLQQTKAALAAAIESPEHKIEIVTGNQSADLDSMCSAILYAYLRSTARARASTLQVPCIPLVHIPREDLDIRPEFQRVFERLSIDPSSIVTLSDLPGPEKESQSRLLPDQTDWILVDHNKLEGPLAAIYANRVSGVIDHHKDEHAVPSTADPRRIEVCGSCTSLVLDHFRGALDEAGSENLAKDTAAAQLAQLGLAAILIDTKNLTNESKVRPVDESAAEWCEAILNGPAGVSGWDRTAFFNELDAAKKDIEGLPVDGILRKDYKEWEESGMRLGMSSVVKPLRFLASKTNDKEWANAAHAFMAQRKLDLWTIMTASVDPKSNEFGRELYIHRTDKRSQAAVDSFVESAGESLRLARKTVDGIDASHSSSIWQQGDTAQTRKQVGPLLREAMKRVERSSSRI